MGGLLIAGYASLFGVTDLAGDAVAPGAFAASLRDWPAARVAMLHQHDPAGVIGRWDRLEEDATGLWAEGRLDPAWPAARPLLAAVQAGQITGLSIGFRTQAATARPRGGRVLSQVALREVSLVAFPMLPGARLRLVQPALVEAPSLPTAA
jgi:uncharacterized protein